MYFSLFRLIQYSLAIGFSIFRHVSMDLVPFSGFSPILVVLGGAYLLVVVAKIVVGCHTSGR